MSSPPPAEEVLNVNVGVLGHVDSGKTSLVKTLSTLLSTAALDKSKESRERGMTLDLGFSCFFLEMPDHLQKLYPEKKKLQMTLVDCPGHASLIRTIIGGAQIIDMVLLVVDAFKGWQAQTTECLVLAELTSPHLVVALNKIDMFPEKERAELSRAKFMDSYTNLFAKRADHYVPNPSFTMMMDGSIRSNTSESVVGETPKGTLRHRSVNKPAEEESPVVAVNEDALEDLEFSKKTTETVQTGGYHAPRFSRTADDEEILRFPENTFSFLLLARYPFCEKAHPEYEEGTSTLVKRRKTQDFLCIPFWAAVTVLTLQILIYTLALQNATDFGNEKNPFNFPIDVDGSTRACELVAVMITVYTENNLFQGVDQFVQSYKALMETPGVTPAKYYFSATTQVLVGLYGIFVTFIIIMQAEGVVDLLLDFTAMEFVAALDDAAYILAKRGFFGTPMKKTAKVVGNSKYSSRDKHKWLRKWPLFLLFAAVMTCFIIVWVMQANRAFGDNEIYVQFHDDVLPWLSTLSGVYNGCNVPSSDISRITKGKKHSLGGTVYTMHSEVGCQENWMKEHGAFFYCDGKHWVFVVGDENKMDPCNKWAMKSIKPNPEGNDVYDIMSHSSELWLAQDPARKSGTGVVEEIQFLAGFESSQNAGRNCSVLASTGNVFTYPFYKRLDEELQQKSFVSERPVYFAGDDVDREYIIYTGRRWAVVKASEIPVCVRNCIRKNSTEPCCKFYPYNSSYTVSYISDPMDLRRIEDTWIPTSDLIWYKASSDYGNSSKPIIEKQSLVDQIDVIEALSSIGAFPTDDEREALVALHLQSARLSCFCDAEDVECEKTVACGADEITVWIDLQTDDRPQDTYFVVAANDTWKALEEAAASASLVGRYVFYYDIPGIGSPGIDSPGITFLNDTGYFDWQDMWNTGFTAKSNYQYTTCMPKTKCGFIFIEDSAGDGITFPGRFNVFLNTRQVERRGRGGRKCLYDLCQESAVCSDSSLRSEKFNPEVECPDDSLPLAIQFFKDTSISLSNVSQWLANEEADRGSWTFWDDMAAEWGHLGFNPMRDYWNDAELNFASTGDLYVEEIQTPVRKTTCMPKASCAIVDFDILDVPFEKFLPEDTAFPFERPIVIFNGTRIGPPAGADESTFKHCVYQFGDSCATKVICEDREIPRPYTSDPPCDEGQNPLALELTTDTYGYETSLILTDLETWTLFMTDLFMMDNLFTDGTKTLFEGGLFEDDGDPQEFTFDSCVPDDVCSVVVLADSFGDGIFNGGMTLVYDNKEILFGPQGDQFSYCIFQFGACETRAVCYDNENPLSLSPFDPQSFQCQTGKPLAFELQSDSSFPENTVVVSDLDSWNQGLSLLFPALDVTGNFTWGNYRIKLFQFQDLALRRFGTCVPDDVCAVLAIRDYAGDGIFEGWIRVAYNFDEINPGSQVDGFTDCVFQFGACETQVVCYDAENPLPPPPPLPAFNPEIDCPGGKSLAIDFKVDTANGEHFITVADFDSWSRGMMSNTLPLSETGYFEWSEVEIYGLEPGTPQRFSTCVPDGLCGVVALEDRGWGTGLQPDDWFTVYYGQEEIIATNATGSFRTCQYQFGPCGQEAVCTESLPPPYNPEIECSDGTPLAFDFHSDYCFYENELLVRPWDFWVQDLWADSSSVLTETGFFEWGTVEISGFDPLSSHHYSTCVPDGVCGVVVLRDSAGDGVFSYEGLRVVYDQKEIPLVKKEGENTFSFCEFQFGSCGQGAYCSD